MWITDRHTLAQNKKKEEAFYVLLNRKRESSLLSACLGWAIASLFLMQRYFRIKEHIVFKDYDSELRSEFATLDFGSIWKLEHLKKILPDYQCVMSDFHPFREMDEWSSSIIFNTQWSVLYRWWSWRCRAWSLWPLTGLSIAPWRWREERNSRLTKQKHQSPRKSLSTCTCIFMKHTHTHTHYKHGGHKL